MVSQREYELLVKCAEDAKKGVSLLNHEFLVENKVTLDECADLAWLIGDALEDYCTFIKPVNNLTERSGSQ